MSNVVKTVILDSGGYDVYCPWLSQAENGILNAHFNEVTQGYQNIAFFTMFNKKARESPVFFIMLLSVGVVLICLGPLVCCGAVADGQITDRHNTIMMGLKNIPDSLKSKVHVQVIKVTGTSRLEGEITLTQIVG